MIDTAKEPICNIQWRHTDTLKANAWNPNAVQRAELRLLERSIMTIGWVQPIIINPEGMIIDGFHRWCISQDSAELKKKYSGMVPCVVMELSKPKAMLLTIRINRAKGTHMAFRMSEIVRELIDVHHYDPEEIAIEIGGTRDEVDLLYQDGVFSAKKIKDYVYSKAWYPAEK